MSPAAEGAASTLRIGRVGGAFQLCLTYGEANTAAAHQSRFFLFALVGLTVRLTCCGHAQVATCGGGDHAAYSQ